MKTLLAVFIVGFAIATERAQTNASTGASSTNMPAPMSAVSNAPTSIKTAMPPPTNAVLFVLDKEDHDLLKKATDEPFIKTDTLVNVFLSAALAVGVGLLADRLREKRDTARKERDEKTFERNTVLAIRREFEAMGKLYEKGIGAPVKDTPVPKVLPVTFMLTEDWFTVFTANAGNLGRIDADIARRIIQCHTLLKGLIEEFRINNGYLAAYKEAEKLGWGTIPGGGNMSSIGRGIQKESEARGLLEGQYNRIKEAEQKLKSEVDELFAVLDERGIK